MEIVKFQVQKTNSFITIPKELKAQLGFEKGDKILLKVIDGKLVAEKC